MMTPLAKKFAAACLATGIAGTGITMLENAAHATPAPIVVKSEQQAPARAVDRDAARYEQRAQHADKQEQYKGGAFIVVGLTTTAAIVAVVLLLLLL